MAEAAFNPDKYLAEKAESSAPAPEQFDPNQYLQEKTGKEPMSTTNAAIVKAEEGSQLGLRPVVAGVGSALGQLIGRSWNQNDTLIPEITDAFKEGRQGAIDEQKQAATEHPGVSTAAEIGGGLLTAPFLGAGKGMVGAARLGAGLGAAQAAGSAQSLPEAIEDVGTAAVGGTVAYGAAKVGGAVATPMLQSLAETKAFKAAGSMLKDFRAAFAKDPQKINDLGRTMLNEGLVSPGDTVKSIANKAAVLKQKTGQEIGAVYNKVLDQITNHETQIAPEKIMEIQAAGFHPEDQADSIKGMLAQKYKGSVGSTAALADVGSIVDELGANGNNITPQHALDLKGQIDSHINWSKRSSELPLKQEMLKDVRGFIQDRLNSQVSLLDQALGTSQSKELLRLNKLYGDVSQIAKISADRVLREGANQSFGMGDKLAAGIGGAIGGLPGAAAGGGLNEFARAYGNSLVATGADALSRGLANPAVYAPSISTTIRKRDDLKPSRNSIMDDSINLGSKSK